MPAVTPSHTLRLLAWNGQIPCPARAAGPARAPVGVMAGRFPRPIDMRTDLPQSLRGFRRDTGWFVNL